LGIERIFSLIFSFNTTVFPPSLLVIYSVTDFGCNSYVCFTIYHNLIQEDKQVEEKFSRYIRPASSKIVSESTPSNGSKYVRGLYGYVRGLCGYVRFCKFWFEVFGFKLKCSNCHNWNLSIHSLIKLHSLNYRFNIFLCRITMHRFVTLEIINWCNLDSLEFSLGHFIFDKQKLACVHCDNCNIFGRITSLT